MVEALRALPKRQRDCVALRYYLDLSIPDIAETLGVSTNSVKTHLQRGLRVHGPDPGGEAMTHLEAVHDALHDDRELRPSPDLFSGSSTASTPTGAVGDHAPSSPLWAAAVALVTTPSSPSPHEPRRRTGHALVGPRTRNHRRPHRHRAVARPVHQAVRPRLRRRRLPRQPADREELHRPHRRRVLPDLHGVHLLHGAFRAARGAGGPSSATSRRASCSGRSCGSGGFCSSSASCTVSTSS